MPASVFTALDADWTPFIHSPPAADALDRWQTDPLPAVANLDELVARIWAAERTVAGGRLALLVRSTDATTFAVDATVSTITRPSPSRADSDAPLSALSHRAFQSADTCHLLRGRGPRAREARQHRHTATRSLRRPGSVGPPARRATPRTRASDHP
jgi:hypothetical protein